MLTKKDFNAMQDLFKQVVDEELDQKIPEHIGNLPTKDEFANRMDELLGEVKTMRETQEIHQGHHALVNDDIETLKTRVTAVEKTLETS
jgi:hypothetical protein